MIFGQSFLPEFVAKTEKFLCKRVDIFAARDYNLNNDKLKAKTRFAKVVSQRATEAEIVVYEIAKYRLAWHVSSSARSIK